MAKLARTSTYNGREVAFYVSKLINNFKNNRKCTEVGKHTRKMNNP